MKTILLPLSLVLLAPAANAQTVSMPDSTGLPGDHFSLEGALEMFKKNIELERFEQDLNTEGNRVNNLDLDGNGETDYVRVESHRDGDAVAIVMSVPVSATENQDVAVIEIEKTGEESATLQIRGDEALYPEGTIVEPFEEKEEAGDGKGPEASEPLRVRVAVNVWFWQPVPWCFSPRYYPHLSPWRWGHYPGWWKPWRAHRWRQWHGWCHHHRTWYRPWNSCRVARAHAVYVPRRAHSNLVMTRYKPAHLHYRASHPQRKADKAPTMKAPGNKARPANTGPKRTAPKGNVKGGGAPGRPKKDGGKK